MTASYGAIGVARLVILLLDTSTVPVPFGTKLIFVLVPPAVNVREPDPVIEPVVEPVPPLVICKAFDKFVLPETYKLLV